MNAKKYSQSGVALLMSLGILALLSILGIAFATNMRLLERTTRDFIYDVQARYIAEAGIEYAIATLKEDARNNFIYNGVDNGVGLDDKVILDPAQGANLPADTNINLTIIDTARQININNANEKLLQCLPNVGSGIANSIINLRANVPLITKQSVCLASGLGNPNDPNSLYNSIKNLITFNSYKDPNVQNGKDINGNPIYTSRSAININTLIKDIRQGGTNGVLEQNFLTNMFAVVDDIGPTRGGNIVSALKNKSNYTEPDKPWIKSWGEFFNIVDNANGIGATLGKRVMDTFNPNREKPVSGGVPTEFCFHSGGTYELTSTATVTRGTQTIASKTITSTVRIFDLWNQTKKEQFNSGYTNYDRITWFDSCPLNINDCYSGYSYNEKKNAELMPGSLKLGYWDDFEEDPDYSKSVWQALSETYSINAGILTTGPNTPLRGKWPIVGLGKWADPNKKWRWEYFSTRAWVKDNYTVLPTRDNDHYNRDKASGPWCYFDVGAHLFVTSTSDRGGGTNQYDIFLARPDSRATCPKASDTAVGHVPEFPETPELHLSGDKKNISNYYDAKTFKIIRTGNGVNDSVELRAYYEGVPMPDNMLFSLQHSYPIQLGLVRVYSAYTGFDFDNIRIIGKCGTQTGYQLPGASEYGYYDALLAPDNLPPANNTFEWGTIFASVTIPNTADADKEKVKLYKAGGTAGSWDLIGTSAKKEDGERGSSITGKIGLPNTTRTIGYRAELISDDSDYSETPVLEDIWVTFIPTTQILYWRE